MPQGFLEFRSKLAGFFGMYSASKVCSTFYFKKYEQIFLQNVELKHGGIMNRKQGQSQRNMKAGQHNPNYGHSYGQDTEYDGSPMSASRFERQEQGRNFSGRSSYMSDDHQMDAERPSSFRDTDYDLDGSTYGSQGRSPKSMDRNFGGRLGSSYGHSNYETNDRNRNPSRYSSLDDDRQGSTSERFGYPSNMNAWSGSDRAFNSGRTSGRTGQGWSGSDMDSHSYGSAGSAQFGSFGEGSLGSSEYRSDRSGSFDHERVGSQSSQRGFFGKGPKGYKRSDDRIKEDVCETLARHPRVDASDIEVKVEDTIVTLSGTVDSKDIRRAAEMAIENLSGVEDVRNELKVKRAGERGMDSSMHSSLNSSSATTPSSSKSSKGSSHL